jgi:hypothetical protein
MEFQSALDAALMLTLLKGNSTIKGHRFQSALDAALMLTFLQVIGDARAARFNPL